MHSAELGRSTCEIRMLSEDPLQPALSSYSVYDIPDPLKNGVMHFSTLYSDLEKPTS